MLTRFQNTILKYQPKRKMKFGKTSEINGSIPLYNISKKCWEPIAGKDYHNDNF